MNSFAKTLVDRTVGSPTLWLALGVAAICASMGFSYSRAQAEADYAMVLRLGPPEPVAVAEANPESTGEGHVIARFDTARAVTVRIGKPGERSDWLAVPLFAAGADGATSRPRPLATSSGLERAAGLAVFPAGKAGPEALLAEGATVFEGALNGPFVPLDAFALDTPAAFAEIGVALPAEFVAVRPWTAGRAAALAPPPQGPLSRYLLWSGLLAVAGAVALSLWPEKGDRYLTITPSEPERKIVTKSRIMADTDRFNPLIGQDDIRRGAMERLHASERAEGRTPSTFFTSNATKVGAGWVKNRR